MFKWRQTEPELILCAVRWYLRYSLSFRDVEELLRERGLEADHTTIWRWVQRYGPELEERLRVTADAAYDTVAVYETAGARGATVVIPPARTANVSGHGLRSPARDRTITLA